MQSDIEFKLTEINAGWINTKIRFPRQSIEFPISTVLWESFFHFLGILYYYCPEHVDSNNFEMEKYIDEFAYLDDGSEWAWKTEFDWCAEPQVMTWSIEREITSNEDFNLKIKCTTNLRQSEMTTLFNQEVSFKNFCFSVVKAVDESIKRNGLMGIDQGVFHDREFVLSHFLYLKAYVLDRLDLVAIKYDGEKKEPISKFKNEIELLCLSM